MIKGKQSKSLHSLAGPMPGLLDSFLLSAFNPKLKGSGSLVFFTNSKEFFQTSGEGN